MLNEAFTEDKMEPGKIMEMVEDDNEDVEFLKYTSNRSKVIQTCMENIERQGEEQLAEKDEDLPAEVIQAIPVTDPSEYDKLKKQGGNPVFVKPQVYSLVKCIAQERTDDLYRYRKEVPVNYSVIELPSM